MDLSKLGVIIIGRNEGERLEKAFASIPDKVKAVLYVDSGSTDGSQNMACARGIAVHDLNPDKPFSAARARKEGVEILLEENKEITHIQFLDGDCSLKENWILDALTYFDENDCAIVCGLLHESTPEISIYNRMNDYRWKTATQGKISACGGIFMISTEAYLKSGGFNDRLLTGEEAEFCKRVIDGGYSIIRLGIHMADHDSDLVSFGAWWKRAIWGGYGDAIQFSVLGKNVVGKNKKKIFSSFFWSLLMPAVILLGAVMMIVNPLFLSLSLLGIGSYFLIIIKSHLQELRKPQNKGYIFSFTLLNLLRKLPHSLGFCKFFFEHKKNVKFVDPHSN